MTEKTDPIAFLGFLAFFGFLGFLAYIIWNQNVKATQTSRYVAIEEVEEAKKLLRSRK